MTRTYLLETLKEFTETATSELILPTHMQKGDAEPLYRPADVYLMRLSDSKAAQKKAPYIIHQVITGKDSQTPGRHPESQAVVRSIFCVYSEKEDEGGMLLLGLIERLRVELLRSVVIGKQFQLDRARSLRTLL